jgi:hypothetical protein
MHTSHSTRTAHAHTRQQRSAEHTAFAPRWRITSAVFFLARLTHARSRLTGLISVRQKGNVRATLGATAAYYPR